MSSNKLLEAYFIAGITVTLICFASGTSPPIVLPDENIHGTQRHHFEIHDLTDISGGKWKAVHIPDEDISSMLETANQNGGNLSMDIQHQTSEKTKIAGVELPVEVHGSVHMFEHVNNKSKNSTGKLIVASENEHRGNDAGPLHSSHPSVIKLKDYVKEEEPKNRELIHSQTAAKPSLIVAKLPEDDDDDISEDLPFRKSPTPIVAPLRKTYPVINSGYLRNNILSGVIHQPKTTPELSPSSKTNVSPKNEFTKEKNDDPPVMEKIKTLLLKSHSSPKRSSVNVTSPSHEKSVARPSATPPQNTPLDTKPVIIPPEVQVPKKVLRVEQSSKGLLLPKLPSKTDAFSNLASVLDRVSSPKKEALLLGIIKALVARDRLKTSARANSPAASLPHIGREAILQDLQNLQMRKTLELPDTANPAAPDKNLDEVYQNEREDEVKQELARANEEAVEAKKIRQEEKVMLENYDRFLNPESRANWRSIGQQQSQTPDGQTLSMLGPQQLHLIADNPSAT